ncbi:MULTISPECIES: RidA family protein [Rhodonellum]|uniref:Enamine deaminase RidA, house cleaning of reactive enamine intermediates, YjgF/YER057c/UK114 family n=1 Tax=Rhodonellum ikkaensis TaxID=336829 RepID=A0A1H3N743_9BACT|nr:MULTISPECIES: RidA family protein [Rhodonellum]SDY84767.1 Enamine deaminase RidA, house cleaning of reactive enamine intermediates, YjgF/YER057c/UK114 family [Rhodonellum ikkaensis]
MKNLLVAFSFICLLACSPEPTAVTTVEKSTSNGWDAEKRIEELGITLPIPAVPVANYVNAVRVGNLIFLSGKGPSKPDGTSITGKVGTDLSIEEGREAARLVGINQLAVLKAELGDLNKVKRIVKVLGMVNCLSDFTEQPKVMNGFSDLMVDVFGEKGKHARSAVGMNALPSNIAVEVELIVEVED